MAKEINIFVAHCGEHEELITDLKNKMIKRGYHFRDSSLTSEEPNQATNKEYIKYEIIKPKIEWASTVVVLVGKETAKSDWVSWEIEEAAKLGKQIIGVWVKDSQNYEIPQKLKDLGDSLVPWNIDSIDNALKGEREWKDANNNPIQISATISRGEC